VRPDEGGNQHALREALRECTRDHRSPDEGGNQHALREWPVRPEAHPTCASARVAPDEGGTQHALREARPTCALARAASAVPALWVRLDKMIAC
jgi:hypothetical protein